MKRTTKVLLVISALSLVPAPLFAQTTGSAGCTAIVQSAANAVNTRTANAATNIAQPTSVKNLSCLTNLFNGTGLNLLKALTDPTTLLNTYLNQICNALAADWKKFLGQTNCGVTLTGFKLGFLGGLGKAIGSGLKCPNLTFGGGGPTMEKIGTGTSNNTGLYATGQALPPTGYPLTTKLGLF
jgi:hypothetical protein